MILCNESWPTSVKRPAAGYDRVVVIAPVVRGGGVMKGVHEQVAELGDEARVALVEPDAEQFRAVIGRRAVSSLLDPARRAPAARAGRRHGLEVASQVAAVWND
ncbi:hypothetical protein ACTWPT_46090 [Nonomuraea sp. 3N208]|uniref:hypothetical protein n=1 Tax=Nonomuraea sp. 3N208 TaxID=3457421 RepID=UPI003FD0D2ED